MADVLAELKQVFTQEQLLPAIQWTGVRNTTKSGQALEDLTIEPLAWVDDIACLFEATPEEATVKATSILTNVYN